MARAASATKIEEEVARCALELVRKEPFFGHLLAGVTRRVTDEVPTAAVALLGARVALLVNPDFFVGLKAREERIGLLKHEVLHLAFHHLARRDPHRHEARRFNLAADLVVNQHLGRWKLPPGGITLASFPTLALEPDRTLEWYYEKLAGAPGEATPHAPHDRWGTIDDATLARPAIDRLIARTAQRVGAKEWGGLPGPLRALVEAALVAGTPQIDWRRALRLFAASSRRTRIAATVRRQSRRFGTFPGIRVRRLARLAVAVDTSGSISDDDLSAFFAEVHGLWRQGAEVHVIECDAAVQRVYPYRGTLPTKVAGRGGTAFDPVFRHLRADRLSAWDGCVYLTDGKGPAPETSPPCPLLWIVTSQGKLGDHLRFGRAVQLRPKP